MATKYQREAQRRSARGDNPDSRHFDSGSGVSAWNGRNSDDSTDEPPWTLTDWVILGLRGVTLVIVLAILYWGLIRG